MCLSNNYCVPRYFVDAYIENLDAEEERGAGQPGRVLAPREPEARGPVGEGAEAHVQPVLDEDVDRVLGPHRSRLQEPEAALHEEDDGAEAREEEVVHIGHGLPGVSVPRPAHGLRVPSLGSGVVGCLWPLHLHTTQPH